MISYPRKSPDNITQDLEEQNV